MRNRSRRQRQFSAWRPATSADLYSHSCRVHVADGVCINQRKPRSQGLFVANINGSRVADLILLLRPRWAVTVEFVDRALIPAASLMNAPAARPFADEGRSAPQTDRDDSFARLLEDERDLTSDAEATQPAPPPEVAAPEKPEPVEMTSEGSAGGKSAEGRSATTAEYQAALNSLNASEATPTADASTTAQPILVAANPSDAGDAAIAAKTATPDAMTAAMTAATVSAHQTNAALVTLAKAAGGTPASAARAPGTEEAADTEETADTEDAVSSDGAGKTDGAANVIAALAGIVQPVPTHAFTQPAEGGSESAAILKPSTANGATPVPADIAGEADATASTPKDSKQADAAPAQGAAPASAQANAHPAASAATQTNAVAAASPSDGAGQTAGNPASATTQAATQPAATSNPLTDATRAVATPPALQSAPAATIQVYTRFIERSDGRAQRFDVRLDPVELGRVDVRIEIGADRKVHAVMAVHDSAALTDLMRGQRALERALSDAGIDLADNGLRFEMSTDSGRGGANQQRDGEANGRSGQPDAWRKFDTASIPVSAEAAAAAMPTRRSQRLDLVA